MINSVLHHLGIGLSDLRAAEQFFDRLLVDFLHLEKENTSEAAAGWKGRGSRIYLYPASSGEPPGALQHLAFSATSRAEVDSFPNWAVRHEIVVTSPPRAYPEYERDYYAVFFAGPEGLVLELVHLSEPDGASPL